MESNELLPCAYCGQDLDVKEWGYFHPFDKDNPKRCPLNGIGWDIDSKDFKIWNNRSDKGVSR